VRRHGSLLSQLLIAFSVFAILIAVAAGLGYSAVVRQHHATKRLTGSYSVLQLTDGGLGDAFNTAQAAVINYSITRDAGLLRPLKDARAMYASRLAGLRRLAGPGLRGLVAAQARAGAAWWALSSKVMTVRSGTPAARAVLGRSAGLAQAFHRTGQQLQVRIDAQIARLTTESAQELLAGLAWSAAAVGVALLLVLAGSLSTLRTITRPLRALTATVRKLTSGDHSARATVTGSAEVREVAQSVNAQADESSRLRAQEAESSRLRAMARDSGLRIREHLAADDVIREAHTVLEENVDADVINLLLITGGRVTPAVGHEKGWLLADSLDSALPADSLTRLQDLFRNQASELAQDVAGPDGDRLPRWVRDGLREAGIGSHLLTPFGVGAEMLGIVAAERAGPGRPWSTAEVDAVESIAADIGRGLHHARLYEAENRLVEDLQSLDAAKSDFFATVSHELRSPLTSIEGYVEMLSDGDGGPVTHRQQQMLASVDRSAVRLRDLIEDVFTLSKLESGAFETARAPVDLTQVITAAIEELRPSVAGQGLTLTSDIPRQELLVQGDASQLDRVLVNLLSNAVKFTPEGGQIQVRATAENGSAKIAVSDTGIGIPETDQDELFHRFFRASNALAAAIPGTGLGLAIVRTIVTNHGGDISLQSQEGKGTSITIHIPRTAPTTG